MNNTVRISWFLYKGGLYNFINYNKRITLIKKTDIVINQWINITCDGPLLRGSVINTVFAERLTSDRALAIITLEDDRKFKYHFLSKRWELI